MFLLTSPSSGTPFWIPSAGHLQMPMQLLDHCPQLLTEMNGTPFLLRSHHLQRHYEETQVHLSLHQSLNHQIPVRNINHPPQRMSTALPRSQTLSYMFQLVTAYRTMMICKM